MAGFDIYEVDIDSGEESRLTWYKFYSMGPPSYLPGDKQFIFAAEYPSKNPGLSEEDKTANERIKNLFPAKYKGPLMYVMERNQRMLKPYIADYSYSSKPIITVDGKQIFFLASGSPKTDGDWQRYYKYMPDGKHQSIAHIKSIVYSAAISPSGDYLVVVCGGDNGNHIVIYNVADGKSKEIKLPDQLAQVLN